MNPLPAQLQTVLDHLIQLVQPEKIYLLGLSRPGKPVQNIFMPPYCLDASLTNASHYDLLIITRKTDKRPFYELHEFIESRCNAALTVSIFIEQFHVFDEWLVIGHPFARRVADCGVPVYDAGTPMANPKAVDFAAEHAASQKDFESWNNKITEFIAGAELFNLRRHCGLAAFMLHQAAEDAYTVLIKAVTGYRLTTHNLSRLIRFASPFSTELAGLFPRNCDHETRLFQLLQNSYIEARYAPEFIVSEEEYEKLHARVKRLHAITKEIVKTLPVYNYNGQQKSTNCRERAFQKRK